MPRNSLATRLDRLVFLRGLGDLGVQVRQAVHRVDAGQVQPLELSTRNPHADQAPVRVLARCGVDGVDVAVAGGFEDETFPVCGEDAPDRAPAPEARRSWAITIRAQPGSAGPQPRPAARPPGRRQRGCCGRSPVLSSVFKGPSCARAYAAGTSGYAAKACGTIAAAGRHPPDYDPFGRCAAVQQLGYSNPYGYGCPGQASAHALGCIVWPRAGPRR